MKLDENKKLITNASSSTIYRVKSMTGGKRNRFFHSLAERVDVARKKQFPDDPSDMKSTSFSFAIFGVACLAAAAAAAAPTVLVCLVVRRDAHTLPHFLDFFQHLDYAKEKLHLW